MDPNDPNAYLFDVAAISPTDAWAVGYYGDPLGRFVTARVLHWDGKTWGPYPAPKGGNYAFLYSVSADSATDVWAVGLWTDRHGGPHPLALHFDGTGWRQVSTVSPSISDVFQAVDVISPTDVWAVGYQEPVVFSFQPLIEHWDGTAWSLAEAPSVEGDSNLLYDVSGTSSTDVWAAGPLGGTGTPPLTMHWDGTSWTVVPAAFGTGRSYTLLAVTAIASDDAWAVGQWITNDYTQEGLAAEHWDGNAWTITSLWSPTKGGQLRGVTATSSTDVWAVGIFWDDSSEAHPLAEHSKGSCS